MEGASQHMRTCVRVCSSRHCFTSVCVILWATKQTSNPRVGFMLPVRGSLFARAHVDRLHGTVKTSLASPCRGRFPNGCLGRNRVCMHRVPKSFSPNLSALRRRSVSSDGICLALFDLRRSVLHFTATAGAIGGCSSHCVFFFWGGMFLTIGFHSNAEDAGCVMDRAAVQSRHITRILQHTSFFFLH